MRDTLKIYTRYSIRSAINADSTLGQEGLSVGLRGYGRDGVTDFVAHLLPLADTSQKGPEAPMAKMNYQMHERPRTSSRNS